jgi:hypothetical protein
VLFNTLHSRSQRCRLVPSAAALQVRHPFNPQHEQKRKRGLELLMQRSKEQDEAENEILQRAAQIEGKRKAEAAARRAAAGPAAGAAPGSQGATAAVVREVRQAGSQAGRQAACAALPALPIASLACWHAGKLLVLSVPPCLLRLRSASIPALPTHLSSRSLI